MCPNPNGIVCMSCGKTHMTRLGRDLMRLMVRTEGREELLKLIPTQDEDEDYIPKKLRRKSA